MVTTFMLPLFIFTTTKWTFSKIPSSLSGKKDPYTFVIYIYIINYYFNKYKLKKLKKIKLFLCFLIILFQIRTFL